MRLFPHILVCLCVCCLIVNVYNVELYIYTYISEKYSILFRISLLRIGKIAYNTNTFIKTFLHLQLHI